MGQNTIIRGLFGLSNIRYFSISVDDGSGLAAAMESVFVCLLWYPFFKKTITSWGRGAFLLFCGEEGEPQRLVYDLDWNVTYQHCGLNIVVVDDSQITLLACLAHKLGNCCLTVHALCFLECDPFQCLIGERKTIQSSNESLDEFDLSAK